MRTVRSLAAITRPGRLLAALAALLVALGSAPPAHAEPVTFAQFRQAEGGNPFAFTDGGADATFTATARVNFEFLSVLGAPAGDQLADLTLTLATDLAGAAAGGAILQPLDPGGTLSLRRISDDANLLTVSFTGALAGRANSRAAAVTASTETAPADAVAFTSDFLDFSGSFDRGLALSFTSLVTAATGQGLTLTGGFVDSFRAAGTGTFSSDFRAVPEPASLAMVGTGALGLLGYARRRRGTARA